MSLHVHFRWGVTLVGDYHYWALLTPSWDPLSGTGPVQVADPPAYGMRADIVHVYIFVV